MNLQTMKCLNMSLSAKVSGCLWRTTWTGNSFLLMKIQVTKTSVFPSISHSLSYLSC